MMMCTTLLKYTSVDKEDGGKRPHKLSKVSDSISDRKNHLGCVQFHVGYAASGDCYVVRHKVASTESLLSFSVCAECENIP